MITDACGCSSAPDPASDPGRDQAIRDAFRLERLTIVWMVVEAAVAIGGGIAAGSLSLMAFGADSVIELLSAGLLLWRLTVEIKRGQVFAEAAERRARRAGGALLFALAASVVAGAAWGLWMHRAAGLSGPGLAVTGIAIPAMAWLSRRKLAVAAVLGSAALRADAMESLTCGWLSLAVLVGLGAQALVGAWWIDNVTALAIVGLLVKEGREAWSGDPCGCC
ncbi:MAG: cation transporter [Azospirillaceae bacterium]|nr:cation transporter [Azospirillaceae bacterium]